MQHLLCKHMYIFYYWVGTALGSMHDLLCKHCVLIFFFIILVPVQFSSVQFSLVQFSSMHDLLCKHLYIFITGDGSRFNAEEDLLCKHWDSFIIRIRWYSMQKKTFSASIGMDILFFFFWGLYRTMQKKTFSASIVIEFSIWRVQCWRRPSLQALGSSGYSIIFFWGLYRTMQKKTFSASIVIEFFNCNWWFNAEEDLLGKHWVLLDIILFYFEDFILFFFEDCTVQCRRRPSLQALCSYIFLLCYFFSGGVVQFNAEEDLLCKHCVLIFYCYFFRGSFNAEEKKTFSASIVFLYFYNWNWGK